MAFTDTWLELAGCSLDDMVAVYLAEALHYLRRGPWNWGDAGAASVELSFLATHGAIDVAPDGTISWETDQVVKGIHRLCATLERDVVSAPESAAVQRVLDTLRLARGQRPRAHAAQDPRRARRRADLARVPVARRPRPDGRRACASGRFVVQGVCRAA